MTKITELKKENIQKIRSCLYDCRIHTKNELSQMSGLSLAGTTNALQYLLDENEILLTGMADSTGGRKSKQYILNPTFRSIGRMILSKELDKYRIRVSIVRLDGEELFAQELTSTKGDLSFFAYALSVLIDCEVDFQVLTISIPGVCKGGVIDICDYEGLAKYNLGEFLSENLGKAYVIENDVNIACIGFSYDVPDMQNIAFVYQPQRDYLGCGLMVFGRLYNGFAHAAGELRYLPGAIDALHQVKPPQEVLEEQLQAICAVMNPEVIAYHSDYDLEQDTLLLKQIPEKYRPKIIQIDDFFAYINIGLYQIGLKNILKMREGE